VLISYILDNESGLFAIEMDAVFVLRAVPWMRVPKTSVFANGKGPGEKLACSPGDTDREKLIPHGSTTQH
jgi:hypothetical protein